MEDNPGIPEKTPSYSITPRALLSKIFIIDKVIVEKRRDTSATHLRYDGFGGEGIMPYCRKCGATLSDRAAYCQQCGASVEAIARLALATWGERLIAWVIDLILLGIFLTPIKIVLRLAWPGFLWAPSALQWIPFVHLGLDNIVYFLYWTFMEGINGQSIGKMAMKIRVTTLNGEPTDLVHAAIQSLGKAFLLPLDCIIGLILYPTERQRLFNYISETLVTKTSR